MNSVECRPEVSVRCCPACIAQGDGERVDVCGSQPVVRLAPARTRIVAGNAPESRVAAPSHGVAGEFRCMAIAVNGVTVDRQPIAVGAFGETARLNARIPTGS